MPIPVPPVSVTDSRLVTPSKLVDSIVADIGIVRDVKPKQSQNAHSSIERIESGIAIEVKLEQPENALCPIEVTESGMVIETKLKQYLNAEAIEVTELGISYDDLLFPIGYSANLVATPFVFSNKTPSIDT